jgi:hypothetical protein
MKVTVEVSDSEMQDILKYSGEKKKGPAIRRLAVDELNYRKRLEMNKKFHSGQLGIDLPTLETIRRDRPTWES